MRATSGRMRWARSRTRTTSSERRSEVGRRGRYTGAGWVLLLWAVFSKSRHAIRGFDGGLESTRQPPAPWRGWCFLGRKRLLGWPQPVHAGRWAIISARVVEPPCPVFQGHEGATRTCTDMRAVLSSTLEPATQRQKPMRLLMALPAVIRLSACPCRGSRGCALPLPTKHPHY